MRRRLYGLLLIGWVGLTLVLTSLPSLDLPVRFPYADKAAHVAFYGVMGFLCGLWRREHGVPAGRAVLQALLFVTAVGAADEVHQHWVPGRSADALDWAADLLGGGAGGALAALLPTLFPFLLTE